MAVAQKKTNQAIDALEYASEKSVYDLQGNLLHIKTLESDLPHVITMQEQLEMTFANHVAEEGRMSIHHAAWVIIATSALLWSSIIGLAFWLF